MFSKQNKVFVGQIERERLAARIYDKRIILAKGLDAKTNFSYNKRQILRLLRSLDKVREVDFSDQDE